MATKRASTESSEGGSPDAETPSRSQGVLAVLSRVPFTALIVATLLIVAALTGTLFSPTQEQPWFTDVGTGYPAFIDGRWWSVATSPWFVAHPLIFLTLLPIVIGGIGWAEWKFGSARTALLFALGHLVGVLGAAGIVALLAPSGWAWADMLATSFDVGPSCGALTALVFAMSTLPSPWRLRARIAVVLWVGISLLYLGHLADLEHAVAMTVALLVSGFLPQFRHPRGRPTARETRLIAFVGLIAIGVIQVIDLVVPYDGPLGQNHPAASWVDVGIDVVIIALIANGVRQGYRLAWIFTLILGSFNVLTVGLYIWAVPLLEETDLIANPREILPIAIAPAALWLALLVVIILGRSAFRVPLRRSKRALKAAAISVDELRTRIREYGGGTISWMTTWNGNERVALERAARGGAAGFQAHAGVAIMLGDPIVPTGQHEAALHEFERDAQRAGLIPCVFSAGAATEQAKPEGWRSVIVAEDTIVDLGELAFTGKAWGAVRTALNKAGREEIEFRMVRLAEQPWQILAQVRAISEQWTGDKGLPEMRFTLGTVEEALDPETWVGLAIDQEGALHGITSWLPVYSTEQPGKIAGWTLDLMRRRDGGFGPVMEFLIASAARHFADEGYDFLSLSGAPLVRPEDAEAGPVDRVLEQIGALIEPLYGFKSLHRFKQKFNPRESSLYLLYRDEGDLPRIGIALTRAYLPDASMRDILASASSTANT